MQDKLVSFIDTLKADGRITSFDEAATKQAVIAKLLSLLGWDFFDIDEVKPEFAVGSKRVDFSLRHSHSNKVFIEVKKISEELEKHQEQLLNYSFQQGVRLAILTNGVTWWLYLPLNEGSWEQRRFYTIDILQQDSLDIAAKFIDFLCKDNVINGNAVQNAERTYRSQQKVNILKQTLPKAWNQIVEEDNSLLIDMINETAEKICGFKADNQLIEQFLAEHKDRLLIKISTQTALKAIAPRQHTKSTPTQDKPQNNNTSVTIRENYTGRSVSSFRFNGTNYDVRSWKEMLMKICDILYHRHGNEFDRVLSLVGRNRPYFTRNKNELRVPEEFDKTGIFIETNLSSNQIVSICHRMAALFGYSGENLTVVDF